MRRIFTASIFAAALLAASFNSYAQTCSVSTTDPNPTPDYTTTLNVTSGNGFTSSNQTTLGTYDNGQTDELISPIYFYQTQPQSAIYFKYNLAAASNPSATVTGYTITIQYGNPMQTITCSQTTTLNLTTTATPYYFTISGINMPGNTNFRIKLDLTVAGGGSNRSVVATAFQANAILAPAGAALPVKFSGFEAKSVSGGINLIWNVAVEENVNGYEVTKSTDGRSYETIGFVDANGNSAYSFLDTKATDATTYYRIKGVDVDGQLTYSPIVTVKGGKASITLRAYPMPVSSELTLQHASALSESQISVSTADGRAVLAVTPAKGAQQTVINLSSFQPGIYLIRYADGKGSIETLKIVKQ